MRFDTPAAAAMPAGHRNKCAISLPGGKMFLLFSIGIEKAAWGRQGGWRVTNAVSIFFYISTGSFLQCFPSVNVARVENDRIFNYFPARDAMERKLTNQREIVKTPSCCIWSK